MDQPPKVSIVIACFNRVDRTVECWKALQITLPASLPCEIIFIDNASTDETPRFLASLAEKSAARVITNETNLGYARANNQGAAVARGKYLILLNNDTIPLNGWIEPVIALAESDPSIGAIGSKLLYPDGRIQHAGVVVREPQENGILTCDHVFRLSSHEAPWVNVEREYQAVTGACFTVRRETFQRFGGFDEAYVNGYEDVDLCFRLRAEGLRVVYCPRSALIHFESSSPGRQKQKQQDANQHLLSARWKDRVRSDEAEIYAAAARPNLAAVRAQLEKLRVNCDKLQASAPDFGEGKVKAGLRRTILRWLGLERNLKQMSADINALQRLAKSLRSIVEANALLLDFREVEAAAAAGDDIISSRADSSSH